MAYSEPRGHETSANKIFTLRACSRVVAAKPFSGLTPLKRKALRVRFVGFVKTGRYIKAGCKRTRRLGAIFRVGR